MELRQLRYFVAVAEERSFTRAASRLHLSQQSLSAAVARFEAQLGCRLLERSSQQVQPTPAGRALLARAPAVFAAVDAAALAMRETVEGVRGEVDQLAGQPLVMFAREGAPDVWDVLVDGLGARRATITQVAVGSQSRLAERVLRGEGLSPISATLSARISRPGLVLRPLHPPLLVPLLLAWQEPATVALQALIDDV